MTYQVKPGGARLGVELPFHYVRHFVEGLVATDGIQYSAVATVGTTAVEILNQLIDPGINLHLKELEVSFTQKFEGLNGSFVGSMNYYWQIRPEARIPSGGFAVNFTGTYINITGTIVKAVGTLATSEDTFEGYAPVGSIPYAPIRLVLTAIGIQASILTGKVKNTSYVRFVGAPIPGT